MGARIPFELRRLAASVRGEVLAAAGTETLFNHCVPASIALRARARASGFDVAVVGGGARRRSGPRGGLAVTRWSGHAWCVFGGAIVDITADQFWRDVPEVYAPALGSPRYRVAYDGPGAVRKVLAECYSLRRDLRLLRELGLAVVVRSASGECWVIDAEPGGANFEGLVPRGLYDETATADVVDVTARRGAPKRRAQAAPAASVDEEGEERCGTA